MQHDEVIWQVIRHHHCSFMAKIERDIFCRNKYNLTGLFYLCVKTIERAHMPNKLWERIKLPRNYLKALELINKELIYWPDSLVHRVKQRLTKMTQMQIRQRELALKTREKIETMPRKETKREARREQKAEKAALIDKNIKKELVEPVREFVEGYDEPSEVEDMEDFADFARGTNKVKMDKDNEKLPVFKCEET